MKRFVFGVILIIKKVSESCEEFLWILALVLACPCLLHYHPYCHTIYEAHFECHDILMLGKSPIKWRRPDMTNAVD